MDYGMRLVANARFVKFEPMKSVKESFIVGQILWRLRARDKNNASLPVIDIDGIAVEIAKTRKLPFGTNDEKKKVYNIIADVMADAVQKMNPVHEQSKMLELEQPGTLPGPECPSSSHQDRVKGMVHQGQL